MPQFAPTTAWTKIASAGSTVEVKNTLTTVAILLQVSSGVPTAMDGEPLYAEDSYRKYDAPLPADLYARAITGGPGVVEVLPIGAAGGGGGGGSGGTVAQGAAGSSPWPVTTTPAGLGAMQAVPAGSTNGTALGTPPAGSRGARLYLPPGASVTFTMASAAPASPPAVTFMVSQAGTGPNWDEDLAGGQMIYVTAMAGSPLFRWY